MARLGMAITLAGVIFVETACASEPAALEVVIEAEQDVAARSSRVLFEVRTQEGDVALSEQFDVAQTPFPIRRLVAPRGGDTSRIVTITVRAVNASGDPLTTARMVRSFVEGSRIEVRVRLYELCLGTNCPEGLTCEPIDGRAECVDASVSEARDAGMDAGLDATSRGDDSTECPTGFQRCDGMCVPVNTPTACGPTCQVCPGSSRGTALCAEELCTLSCNQGLELCMTQDGQDCVNRQTNRNHCGSCGNVCSDAHECLNGNCVRRTR